MNLSPYGNSAESVALDEPNWQLKYLHAATERDKWQDRAYALEARLRESEAKLAEREAPDLCSVPTCSTKRAGLAVTPLCRIHLEDAHGDMESVWRNDWAHMPSALPPHVRKRMESSEPAPWVVYYIEMGPRVKIGRTTDLTGRMRTFSAHPDQLLAVEPGVIVDGVTRELQRHREFAEWRVKGTELFEDSPELRSHIAQVVATFGDPRQHLQPHAA